MCLCNYNVEIYNSLPAPIWLTIIISRSRVVFMTYKRICYDTGCLKLCTTTPESVPVCPMVSVPVCPICMFPLKMLIYHKPVQSSLSCKFPIVSPKCTDFIQEPMRFYLIPLFQKLTQFKALKIYFCT